MVNKYHYRLCKHSYWFTHYFDTSRDIVQDCWRTIINKLDGLKDPNLFGIWAFRIVTRKSLDFVSKKKKGQEKLQGNYKVKTSIEIEENIELKLEKLCIAIPDLTKAQQQVLHLFFIENYSLNEISELFSISAGKVKLRLFLVREKLKTILKK